MTEKEKRKEVAKISVFITSIFVIFLSISYAFINQTLTGTKKQVIQAGNLQLNLTEGDSVTLENALPMYDEVGMTQKPFTFSIENTTANETNYVLKLVDVTQEGRDKLDTSTVKYSLEKGNVKKIKELSSIRNGIIDKGKITGKETITYSLRLWINSIVQDENLIKGKSISYQIHIEASQDSEIMSSLSVMEARGTENMWQAGEFVDLPALNKHYRYSYEIAEVIFEDEIYIPDTIDTTMVWDVSEAQDKSIMSYLEVMNNTNTEENKYRLHIQGNGGIKANPDCSGLFYHLPELTQIEGLEYFDTSDVINMSDMFNGYGGSHPLDLSNFDTSNVTNMSDMFSSYSSSQPLYLSKLNTSKVTSMSSMFSFYSGNQPLDLSNFDTSNVTNIGSMFYRYSGGFDNRRLECFKCNGYD